MSKTRTILVALLLSFLPNAPALAQRTNPPPPDIQLGVTLATPPLPIGPGAVFLFGFPAGWCQVVNVSMNAVLVGAKIFDLAGTEIGQHGDGTDPSVCKAAQSLEPNRGCLISAPNEFVGWAYCRITVVGGGKEAVRASLTDGAVCQGSTVPLSCANHGTVAAQ